MAAASVEWRTYILIKNNSAYPFGVARLGAMVGWDKLPGINGATTMLSSVCVKYRATIVAAAIMLAGTSVEAQQTGTVHLHVVNAGFIVSTGSGTGTLNYKGREYRLSVTNVSFGTIGLSRAELMGTAHNLRSATDIVGTYRTVAAGLTVGGGVQVARFQNANGVILELAGIQVGVPMVLGSDAMTIGLQ
jgi:hypothetical protein